MARFPLTPHLFAACLLASGIARATPNFPAVIETHLSASSLPGCEVCHLNGVTGFGTVTTRFGVAARTRGLMAYDEGALKAALDSLATEKVDSDADGLLDTEELKAGTDPNTGSGPDPDTPRYGCGASVVPGGVSLPLALWVLRRMKRRGKLWRSGTRKAQELDR